MKEQPPTEPVTFGNTAAVDKTLAEHNAWLDAWSSVGQAAAEQSAVVSTPAPEATPAVLTPPEQPSRTSRRDSLNSERTPVPVAESGQKQYSTRRERVVAERAGANAYKDSAELAVDGFDSKAGNATDAKARSEQPEVTRGRHAGKHSTRADRKAAEATKQGDSPIFDQMMAEREAKIEADAAAEDEWRNFLREHPQHVRPNTEGIIEDDDLLDQAYAAAEEFNSKEKASIDIAQGATGADLGAGGDATDNFGAEPEPVTESAVSPVDDSHEEDDNVKFAVKTGSAEKPLKGQDKMFEDEERGLIGVFDGVGGHDAGDVVAEKARDVMYDVLSKRAKPTSIEEAQQNIRDAFALARNALAGLDIKNGGAVYEGGTTAAVAQTVETADGMFLVAGNAGDSRIILWRDGQATGVTKEQGNGRDIFNCLATSDIPDLMEDEFTSVQLKDGDKVLVCSDGITGYRVSQWLTEEEFADAFNQTSPGASAERFIALSKKQDDKSAGVMFIETTGSSVETHVDASDTTRKPPTLLDELFGSRDPQALLTDPGSGREVDEKPLAVIVPGGVSTEVQLPPSTPENAAEQKVGRVRRALGRLAARVAAERRGDTEATGSTPTLPEASPRHASSDTLTSRAKRANKVRKVVTAGLRAFGVSEVNEPTSQQAPQGQPGALAEEEVGNPANSRVQPGNGEKPRFRRGRGPRAREALTMAATIEPGDATDKEIVDIVENYYYTPESDEEEFRVRPVLKDILRELLNEQRQRTKKGEPTITPEDILQYWQAQSESHKAGIIKRLGIFAEDDNQR